MKPMEIFRVAVAEIGDVSAAELSAHLEKKHGVKIEPAFIPLFKATLQDLERTNKSRQNAKIHSPETIRSGNLNQGTGILAGRSNSHGPRA
jgi:hypothetical protein